MTAAHVVDGAMKAVAVCDVTIQIMDARIERLEVIGIDRRLDLATIAFERRYIDAMGKVISPLTGWPPLVPEEGRGIMLAGYPGADRMSFVFLECPQQPLLDGRLVEVATAEDCLSSGAESLRGADFYLCGPSVHLRYYLEDWTDCLFSWIKFFLINDFWWHRWEELQGYADYRQVFEDLAADRGRESAEEAAFDAVLGTFAQHAEHWIGEVEGWAKAEQG